MAHNKPKILVLFYSMYGHIFRMANAVVEGVREGGGEPILKQVSELVPEEFWNEDMKKAKELMKDIPVADRARKGFCNITFCKTPYLTMLTLVRAHGCFPWTLFIVSVFQL